MYFKESYKGLPTFDSKNSFFEFCSNIEHDILLLYSKDTVESAVRKTNNFVVGKRGETGNNLRDIMKNCIEYAQQHSWTPSDKERTDLEDSVSDAYQSARSEK
jgi:hypothetical protein